MRLDTMYAKPIEVGDHPKWNHFDVIFLEQYKTHRGGEGASRVGMEWEDRKLIFTQTGKKKIA